MRNPKRPNVSRETLGLFMDNKEKVFLIFVLIMKRMFHVKHLVFLFEKVAK